MKDFKDWSIRYKFFVPLLAIMALGGGGVILALMEMHDEITNDPLSEERAIDSIRRASLELLGEYREFIFVPSDSTQRKIDELKEVIKVYEAAFAETAGTEEKEIEAGFVEAIEVAEQKLQRIGDETVAARRRLLDQIEAGRVTVALPSYFLAKLEVLEEIEDDLLDVLEGAGFVIAQETDEMFKTGFAKVASLILAVLVIITLVGYAVAQGIARQVTILVNTANRLGGGDFSVRADVGSKDEIGGLATAFNQMATSLESNIEQREHAENDLKALNAELEQRVKARTAELTATNEELEAFAYTISHDLRAPLRSMDGFSQALLEDCTDKLDAKGRDYLKRVRGASQTMARLIDDILNLSRVTRARIEPSEVDLSGLAQATARELRQIDSDRQVVFDIAPGVVANGDARLLRQVFDNLLDNAWKFTAKNPRACIEFGVTDHEGEPAYYVRDDGAGFDMAYADKLFEPFQRLHSAAEFAGSGVGLATVARIVRRHGGRVWAESEIGRGATVYFTLSTQGTTT